MTKALRKLTTRELNRFLKKHKLWKVNSAGSKMTITLTFKTHVEALVFIAKVTVLAEVTQHHPDIEFTYRKIKITLWTHEIKGLTKKDFELAERISKSLEERG